MLLFCLAAGVGAVLRYLMDFYLPRHGILLVNILGSFLAGTVWGASTELSIDASIVQLVLGGFAGSLTTYATVAVSTAQQRLSRKGSPSRTWALQMGLSVTACCFGLIGTTALLS